MSNCYPQRNLKTGKIQKSLCENCANTLQVKYLKIHAFWVDDLMKAAEDIENEKIFEHNQQCIYLRLSKTINDIECIIVTECNQYKPERLTGIIQKTALIEYKSN